MFQLLKKSATMTSVIAAFAVAFTVSASAGNVFVQVKNPPAGPTQSNKGVSKNAVGQVCCSVPRKRNFVLVKPLECRRLKGSVMPLNKCAQAAKAKEAYFVKVDSETTTEADRPAQPGRSSVRPK